MIKGEHPPRGKREQYFLLWHLWFVVRATTNPGTRVLLQELHRKSNLPCGLAVTAYLGGISHCCPIQSPALFVGWGGSLLVSTYGCAITIEEQVNGHFPMDISKHKSITDYFQED